MGMLCYNGCETAGYIFAACMVNGFCYLGAKLMLVEGMNQWKQLEQDLDG